MSTQEKAPAIYAAMSAIQKDLSEQGISKDRKNTMQNYSFRGIDDVYQHLSPLMAKHGVVLQHVVVDQNKSSFTNAKQTLMFHTVVTVEYTYYAVSDGSSMTTKCIGEAMDSSDKSTNKAISAAFKYNALNTFCIPVKGMDDADESSPEVTHSTKPPVVKPEPKPELASGEGEVVLSSITRLVNSHMKKYGLTKEDIKEITGVKTTAGLSLDVLKQVEKKLIEYGVDREIDREVEAA